MGIQGLLPLLKSIHKPCHLRKFAGQTIGVDAYGWLHRGVVACAVELATDKPTSKYIDFTMNRVRMLIHFGVTPYLVFDGDNLPSKAGTNKERRKRRQESRKLGMQLLDAGKPVQAHAELQKAVDVTPEMAGALIQELRRAGVQYIVAPYEADSQLAYLEKKGIIQGILSEDSDLLVFGARILLTKLDQYGECVMIRRDDFTACREISLVGWTDTDFRRMAIMSGCDYLPSIEKMGLKTAYRLLRKHKTIENVIRTLQFDGKFKVPTDYAESFNQAELAFLHQWVFCPLDRKLVNFTPVDAGTDPSSIICIGSHVTAEFAQGVAKGLLHPRTKERLNVPITQPKANRFSTPSSKVKPSNATNAGLKNNASLDSFFRPRRTPLAELDPNSFAVSPNQQQTLHQAMGVSWPATPSPIIQSHTTTAATVPNPIRRTVSALSTQTPTTMPSMRRHRTSIGLTPSVFRSTTEQASARARTSSEMRATKRVRLCESEVAEIANGHDQAAHERSKFFTTTTESKGTTREPWSDDLLDDALLGFHPNGVLEPASAKSKKIAIFEDVAPTEDAGLQPGISTQQAAAVEFPLQSTVNSEIWSTQGAVGSDLPSPDSSPDGAVLVTNPRPKGLAARFSYFAKSPSLPPTPQPPTRKHIEITTTVNSQSPVQEDLNHHDNQMNSNMTTTSSFSLDDSTARREITSSILAVHGSEDLLVSESDIDEQNGTVHQSSIVFDVSKFAFVPALT